MSQLRRENVLGDRLPARSPYSNASRNTSSRNLVLCQCFTGKNDWKKLLPVPKLASRGKSLSTSTTGKASRATNRVAASTRPFHVQITQQLHHNLHCSFQPHHDEDLFLLQCEMKVWNWTTRNVLVTIFFCMAFFSVLLFFFSPLLCFCR